MVHIARQLNSEFRAAQHNSNSWPPLLITIGSAGPFCIGCGRLERELQRLTDETDRELRATRGHNTDLARQLEEVKDQLTLASSDLKEMRTRLDELMKDHNEAKGELKDTKAELKDTQATVDKVEEERDGAKARHQKYWDSALRRRVAITLEREIKLSCVRKLQGKARAKFFTRKGEVLMYELNKSDLFDFMEKLTDEEWEDVLTEWFGGKEEQFDLFRAAMDPLKEFSRTMAHPKTTVDDEPVTVAMAKELIDSAAEKDDNGKVVFDTESKDLVKKYIDKVAKARATNKTDEKDAPFL